MKNSQSCTNILLILWAATALVVNSFTPTPTRAISSPPRHSQRFTSSIQPHSTFLHLSSPQDDESKADAAKTVDATKDYPIDVASPILLGSSMLLAITSVGSIFELIGGSPMLGFIISALFTLVGVPSSLFLFYAAIKKASAETAADDAEYLKDYY